MTEESPQDYETTEKVERTDVGFRLTVESTRGTGTRDQDKVKMEARTEGFPDDDTRRRMRDAVKEEMEERRLHLTNGDDE